VHATEDFGQKFSLFQWKLY